VPRRPGVARRRAVCTLPGVLLFALYAAVAWASKVALTFLLVLIGCCFLPPGNVRPPQPSFCLLCSAQPALAPLLVVP